jgi:hypothetical protein
MLALLTTPALNLLRCNGFRSIRAGLMAVAHDISRMLGWIGVSLAETGREDFQSALPSRQLANLPVKHHLPVFSPVDLWHCVPKSHRN